MSLFILHSICATYCTLSQNLHLCLSFSEQMRSSVQEQKAKGIGVGMLRCPVTSGIDSITARCMFGKKVHSARCVFPFVHLPAQRAFLYAVLMRSV